MLKGISSWIDLSVVPTREIEKLRYGSRVSRVRSVNQRRHISILPLSRTKCSQQRYRPNFKNSRLEKAKKNVYQNCLLECLPEVSCSPTIYVFLDNSAPRGRIFNFESEYFQKCDALWHIFKWSKNAPHILSEILVFQVCLY